MGTRSHRSISNGKRGIPLEVIYTFRTDFSKKKGVPLAVNRNIGIILWLNDKNPWQRDRDWKENKNYVQLNLECPFGFIFIICWYIDCFSYKLFFVQVKFLLQVAVFRKVRNIINKKQHKLHFPFFFLLLIWKYYCFEIYPGFQWKNITSPLFKISCHNLKTQKYEKAVYIEKSLERTSKYQHCNSNWRKATTTFNIPLENWNPLVNSVKRRLTNKLK